MIRARIVANLGAVSIATRSLKTATVFLPLESCYSKPLDFACAVCWLIRERSIV